jgi:hypothetical protein
MTSNGRQVKWEDLLKVKNPGHTGSEAALAIPNGACVDVFGQRGGPTITGEKLTQTHGKFYYEIILETIAYFQVGWATPGFVAKPDEGKGCGDDSEGMSWSYDGNKGVFRYAREDLSLPSGFPWKSGDVVGLCIDIDGCYCEILLNAVVILSTSISTEPASQGVFPAVSLARGEHCQLRFGTDDTPFLNSIPAGYSPWPVPDNMFVTANISKLLGPVPIIPMTEGSYSTNCAGMMMVHMMQRGIDYEASKNALVGAGLRWARKLLPSRLAALNIGDAEVAATPSIGGTEVELSKEQTTASALSSSLLYAMTEDQMLAVIIYTLGHPPYPPVYRFFNSDTRKGTGKADGNDFPILFQLLEDGCRALLGVVSRDYITDLIARDMRLPTEPPVGFPVDVVLSGTGAPIQVTNEGEARMPVEDNTSLQSRPVGPSSSMPPLHAPLPPPPPRYPYITYRGVGVRFHAHVGDKIRFGQFTSTSANRKIAEDFIAQEGAGGTLFTIRSKLGAPIWELSEFPDEMEVLVPPCEPFRVVDVKEEGKFIMLESLVTPSLVQQYVADVETSEVIAGL